MSKGYLARVRQVSALNSWVEMGGQWNKRNRTSLECMLSDFITGFGDVFGIKLFPEILGIICANVLVWMWAGCPQDL